MLNTLSRLAGIALVGTMFVAPAFADGKKDCTTEPQAKWQKQADAEAEAKKAGYDVRRSKIEGQCYEVYGVKDGTMHELFYNPMDLKLMMTVKK